MEVEGIMKKILLSLSTIVLICGLIGTANALTIIDTTSPLTTLSLYNKKGCGQSLTVPSGENNLDSIGFIFHSSCEGKTFNFVLSDQLNGGMEIFSTQFTVGKFPELTVIDIDKRVPPDSTIYALVGFNETVQLSARHSSLNPYAGGRESYGPIGSQTYYFAQYDLLFRAVFSLKTNTPPVADADGPYSGIVGSPVVLDGTGSSDPDGDDLTYSWSTDGSCTFDDATSPTPQLTCTTAGTFNVTLTVDDGGASDSDTTTVTMITPQGAIASLIDKIESLMDDGVLKPGQAKGLIRPLENGIKSLDKGNVEDACNQLDDFIDKVYAKTPSPLDATTADELIEDAFAIQDAIGCL